MDETSLELWQRFVVALTDSMRSQPDEAFRAGWASCAARTRWYAEVIMPSVAMALGLEFEREFLLIDYVMSESSIPLIFIESENDAFAVAGDELRKLASVAGPLKVLITCVEWSDTPGDWPDGGRKEELLRDWSGVLNSHHARRPQDCIFGICVAEICGSRFRLYTKGLGPDGAVVEDERVSLERRLG